jgi:glycosyltransferase involved in cell wall biosynthesis
MRVLALTKYGFRAATTRQRFRQYEPALAAAGITVDYAPLLDDDHLQRLVAGKSTSLFAVARGYVRRLIALIGARRFDVLWVHYELFPYLPGTFERLATVWRKPVIVDYDDAIFHIYDAAPNPLVRRFLGRKLAPLLRRAAACCCGNAYLQRYAEQYCPNSIILPTVVDTSVYRPSSKSETDGAPVIGWIGSPSTWRNVQPLLPLLRRLHDEFGVRLRVVGAGDGARGDRFDGLELVEWSEESEVADVQGMDIGIMPLRDGPFERGKCGYKLIQYMACGLPVVASPIGVNSDIVSDGENGFLASSEDEWRRALERLIGDRALRERMGQLGRKRVENGYSLASQAPRLVELFRSIAASSR